MSKFVIVGGAGGGAGVSESNPSMLGDGVLLPAFTIVVEYRLD